MSTSQDQAGEAVWTQFLSTVEGKLSAHVLKTWLEPAQCIGVEDGALTLAVRDSFARDWLSNHYLDFMNEELSLLLGAPTKVSVSVMPERFRESDSCEPISEPAEAATPPASSPTPMNPTRPKLSLVPDSVDPARAVPRHLNSRYLFDEFVCGPSNQFAYAAARAVAAKPGQSYNPLFIFGGVGLGKTHLLTAIGLEILGQRPDTRVIYTTAEQFSNEVVNAVLNGKLEDFRSRYRQNADLILMDDIQLLAGKERTQHELFHVFNTLYDSQRQIVLTSDKLPHELPEMEERLRNRFQWGLITDIQAPEVETRVAILRQKAKKDSVYLPDDVAFFLAKNLGMNVRQLEGALVRVVAHASLTRTPIDLRHAQRVLADIMPGKPKSLTLDAVQKLVASYFQVKVSDLKSSARQKAIVRPRQIAMYLCREHVPNCSFPDIGKGFGKKDHTTAMNACKKIGSMLKQDPSLRSQVLDLERQLDL